MGTMLDRAAELVAHLEPLLDVRVTVDPVAAIPPCVLITPATRTFELACGYTAQWSFVVLVPPPANMAALTKLDELVDQLVDALGPDATEATPGLYPMPGQADPLPCYTVKAQEAIA